MPDIRVLITGSRSWPMDDDSADQIWDAIKDKIINATSPGDTITFVVGDCPTGVDFLISNIALRFPLTRIVQMDVYTAQWEKYRARGDYREAGPARNQAMVNSGADFGFAFICGRSIGTRNCASKATRAGINIKYIHYKRDKNNDSEQSDC